MATTTAARADYTCGRCGESVPDARAQAGYAYCSEACYLWDRGESIIDTLRHDHTLCSSCFRTLKTIYRPEGKGRGLRNAAPVSTDSPKAYRLPAQSNDAQFIGWQTLTPATTRTERDTGGQNDYQPIIGTRESGCVCGSTHHGDTHGFIQRDVEDVDAVVDRLYRHLEALYDDGTIDHAPDIDRLSLGFWAGGPALGAGLACYA